MSVSELKVSRKATILNRCTSTESHWNTNDDSLRSPATEISRSPSSYNRAQTFWVDRSHSFQSNRNINVCSSDCGVFRKISPGCCLSCSARRGGCRRNIRRCDGVCYSCVPDKGSSALPRDQGQAICAFTVPSQKTRGFFNCRDVGVSQRSP